MQALTYATVYHTDSQVW